MGHIVCFLLVGSVMFCLVFSIVDLGVGLFWCCCVLFLFVCFVAAMCVSTVCLVVHVSCLCFVCVFVVVVHALLFLVDVLISLYCSALCYYLLYKCMCSVFFYF